MQDNMPNLKELARMAGIPTEPVSIVDVPNISTPQADLADEIAEAISDTLDMDWQPSWAAPNIIAIINRERRLAREEGAKAMQAVEPALYQLRNHQQQADMDRWLVSSIANTAWLLVRRIMLSEQKRFGKTSGKTS